MAMYKPCPRGEDCSVEGHEIGEHNAQLHVIETVFLIIFTLEVLLKLGALGGSFFKDGWNQLDFVIVATGYLVFLFPDANTSIFRTMRVLRPLRSIGMMPGVRLLIDALIASLPGLSAVMVLIAFMYAIFGVLAVQLFGGTLDNHCVPALHCTGSDAGFATNHSYLEYGRCATIDDCITPASWTERAQCVNATVPEEIPVEVVAPGQWGFCRLAEDDPDALYSCDTQHPFEPEGAYVCVGVNEELHHGATGFNNIGKAMLVLFQLTTTEGWTTIMTPLLNTNSEVTVYVYFTLALVLLSFFLVNFVVAQMVVAFSRAVETQDNARPPEPNIFNAMWGWFKRKFFGGGGGLASDVWQMRAMFNRFDIDSSGYLDNDEVAGLAEALNIQVTLEEMDYNQSGSVRYPEFERWWKMRSAFERYDIDGDNALSTDECHELVNHLNLHTDFQDAIVEMDQDESGNVSYEEFVSWWSIRHKFETLDISRDDSLSLDELEGLVEKMGVPRLLIDTMSDNADRNMDGKLDFDEFMLWWQLYRMFERFDTDDSWELESGEVAALGAALKMGDLKVSDINPRKSDTEHGISFKEMVAWWGKAGKDKKRELMRLTQDEMDVPKNLRFFVQSPLFTNIVLGAVIANFVVLALDHHNINSNLGMILETCNVGFTIFFAVEMVLKLAGLGFGDYFGDQFNCLDFLIVMISLVELLSTNEGALSAMRTLRLLRVVRSFKIFTAVDSMRRLLDATMKSGAAILNFAILLETFHVIFALVGLHLFGDELTSPLHDAPGRFDTFWASYLTTFQVITRENWHELLYVTWNTHGWGGFFYYATTITLLNFVIVSLFLGNLLYSLQIVFMAEATKMSRKATNKVPGQRFIKKTADGGASTSLTSLAFQGKIVIPPNTGAEGNQMERERLAALMIQRAWLRKYYRSLEALANGPQVAVKSLGIFEMDSGIRVACTDIIAQTWFDPLLLVFIVTSSIMLSFESPHDDGENELTATLLVFDTVVAIVFFIEFIMKVVAKGFVDAEEAYLRTGWECLDFFVVVVTVAGFFDAQFRPLRIMRAFRVIRPLKDISWLPGLRVITEAMIKSMIPIAIVGAISVFSCMVFAVAFVALQKGKLYSCELNVCRAGDDDWCQQTEGCSRLAHAENLPEMEKVCAAVGAEWTGDAKHLEEICLGAGACVYTEPLECSDPECYLTWQACEAAGGEWVLAEQNFNHIGSALLTLFELTTLEDWQGLMYNSIDTTQVDVGFVGADVKSINATFAASWSLNNASGTQCSDDELSCYQSFERAYRGSSGQGGLFMGFIVVGAFFFLNLFLGVVANAIGTVDTKAEDAALRLKEKMDNTIYYISSVSAMRAQGAYYQSVRRPCLALITNSKWDFLIASAIVVNIGFMMTETSDQGDGMVALQASANIVFTIVFLVELVVKVLALNPRRAFRDVWNWIDLLIVVMSLVELVIEYGGLADGGEAIIEPTLFRTIRIFRLTRMLKLVPHCEGLGLIVSASCPPPNSACSKS